MRFTLIDFSKIIANDFYTLIKNNEDVLKIHFPKTLSYCQTIDQTQDFIDYNLNEMKDQKSFSFCIANLDTNQLIGYIKLFNIDDDISKCELAYFTDLEHQRKGIMSIALGKIIYYAFQKLTLEKIYIRTAKNNIPSQKTVINQDFIQEGILRNEFRDINGQLHDSLHFCRLKSTLKHSSN